MKKYWYISIAVLVVLLVVSALLIDSFPIPSSSSYGPIPMELRMALIADWPAEQFGGHLWGHESTEYYGTHKDCVAFFYQQDYSYPYQHHSIEVAGSYFSYENDAQIYVYRDGEFLKLDEAYEQGWLNKRQIRSIAQYHIDSQCNEIGYAH